MKNRLLASWFIWLYCSDSVHGFSSSSSRSRSAISSSPPSIRTRSCSSSTLALCSQSSSSRFHPAVGREQASSRRRLNLLSLSSDNKESETVNATIHESTETTQTSELAITTAAAASAPGESSSSSLPSYRKLIVFTATTILIWISEPLLSLVDTTIVGMTSSAKSSVVQIAALGPATTLYDSSIYMTYFLAMATTNLIAPALAQKNWKQLQKSTSHLMGLAVLFGTAVSVFAFAFGRTLITSMVGTSLSNNQIVPLATNYAWIRAAVAPFSVVDFVAQSFCLANLDTKTPAMAVAVAAVVNIIGDLALSPRWGIQGAAVATAVATVSSSLILVRKVRLQTAKWKRYQEEEEGAQDKTTTVAAVVAIASAVAEDPATMKPKTQVVDGSIELFASSSSSSSSFSSSSTDGEASTTGDVVNMKKSTPTKEKKEKDIPFWSLPDKKSLVELLKLAGPIFFVMMGKIACYSIMTVRATNFGLVPLASHNIMMRVFFFFACFGDSLSQAAQTFFPQVVPKERGQLIRRLLYLSAGVGVFVSQSARFILSQLGGYLTKDAVIIKTMAEYAPYVGSAVLLHPFILLLEGTILARRDLVFMVGMYMLTMALHFRMVFSPLANSFRGLWQVFFIFQAMRLVQFAIRVGWKSVTSDEQPVTPTPTAMAA